MKIKILLFTVGVWITVAIMTYSVKSEEYAHHQPTTVDSVDLKRYSGLWYEVARIPNTFQKDCNQEVTAFYVLRKDGKVDVINRCRDKNGKIKESKGRAKVVDTRTNARLKVSFFRPLGISLFWGDYWIIGLDENYSWAVVGTPNRQLGWILSRRPWVTNEDKDKIQDLLMRQGYNPDAFLETAQKPANAPVGSP